MISWALETKASIARFTVRLFVLDGSVQRFRRKVLASVSWFVSAALPTICILGIVILIMAVLSVVAIRFGYKALLIEWAIDAISKAEKEFVGTKLGEARLAVVVSWLREKVPAPIRFLVTDDLIRKAVQTSFNAAKSGLEVLKNA